MERGSLLVVVTGGHMTPAIGQDDVRTVGVDHVDVCDLLRPGDRVPLGVAGQVHSRRPSGDRDRGDARAPLEQAAAGTMPVPLDRPAGA